MARKNKKRSQIRKPQRGSSGAGRADRPAGLPPSLPSPSDPGVQPIEATQPPVASPPAARPLERVPYFRSDLRRIAITAGFMFVLLIAGSIVLRGLLQA